MIIKKKVYLSIVGKSIKNSLVIWSKINKNWILVFHHRILFRVFKRRHLTSNAVLSFFYNFVVCITCKMRNCRCSVFFFACTASSSFHRPSTSHQASQSQSCRLAWLSARVESFSVNGQPPLPSPLTAPSSVRFQRCGSPSSTCCFAFAVVIVIAVCFRPFFFSYASHAAPCPYFFVR